MVLQAAIDALYGALERSPWAKELAGILPLSFLIDFIEIAPKIHVMQLVGSVPLWAWVITPSGSRLLLGDETSSGRDCYQDKFGATGALEVLDGRYGERYLASSPETLRLILASHRPRVIPNRHQNLSSTSDSLRIQELEVVHVSRAVPGTSVPDTSPGHRWSCKAALVAGLRQAAPRYLIASSLGWLLLLGFITVSAVFRLWISLAFFVFIIMAGTAVLFLHGGQPRRLLVTTPSKYERLLVVAEHMNTSRWLLVIGESTIVNSLLNRPLEPQGPAPPARARSILRWLLRIAILGQWGAAIGAATTKDWSAYSISIWQCLTIVFQAFLLTPTRSAEDWAARTAHLKIRRFSTRLSSRRALLNTVVALNPDTFEAAGQDGSKACSTASPLSSGGMKWIDPILTASSDRLLWEEATRKAMLEAQATLNADDTWVKKIQSLSNFSPSQDWEKAYSPKYWHKYIPEGIYLAAEIRCAMEAAGVENGLHTN